MDWKGLIAAILAGGLSLALVVGVSAVAWQGRALTEKGAEALIAICVAMTAAISAYLAARNNHNDHRRNNQNGDRKPGEGKDRPDENP